MNITIFGYKFRLEILVLCVLLIWFIQTNTFFSCAGGVKPGLTVLKEGFAVAKHVATNGVKNKKKKVVPVVPSPLLKKQ